MRDGIIVAAQLTIVAAHVLLALYLVAWFHPLGPKRVTVTLRVAGVAFFLFGATSRLAAGYESATLFASLAVPEAICGLLFGYLVVCKLDMRITTEAQVAAAADVEFVKAVMDNSITSIAVIDEDGVVLGWNRTAVDTFGYTREDAIGTPISDLIVPPAWRVQHLAGLAMQRKGKRGPVIGRSVEVKARCKNGASIPVELSIQALDFHGQRRYVGFMRDLTNKVAVQDRYRRLLEAATESESNERMRIADELHDDVVQVMVAAMLQLDTVKYKLGDDPLGERLSQAIGTLRLATERTRSLMFDLHGHALGGGLCGALTDLCDTADFAEFECSVDCSTNPVDPLLEELLFRTIREALFNSRKHSRAERLRVTVHTYDDRIEASVSDDGVGFVLNDQRRQSRVDFHRGIPGMIERVQIAGGQLDVFTSPGIGCTIFITIPNRPGLNDLPRPFVAADADVVAHG